MIYVLLTINLTLPDMILDLGKIKVKKNFYKSYGESNTYLLILILTSKILNRYNILIEKISFNNSEQIKKNIVKLLSLNTNYLDMNKIDLIEIYYSNIKNIISSIIYLSKNIFLSIHRKIFPTIIIFYFL